LGDGLLVQTAVDADAVHYQRRRQPAQRGAVVHAVGDAVELCREAERQAAPCRRPHQQAASLEKAPHTSEAERSAQRRPHAERIRGGLARRGGFEPEDVELVLLSARGALVLEEMPKADEGSAHFVSRGLGSFGVGVLELHPVYRGQDVDAAPLRRGGTLTSDAVPVNVDAVLFQVVHDPESRSTLTLCGVLTIGLPNSPHSRRDRAPRGGPRESASSC
jgi:hypothetical protein